MLRKNITCPISLCIFHEPVQLLLVDDRDGSVVVEKQIYENILISKNPCCPITRNPIRGFVKVREIENIVAWYLDRYPEEKINQYVPSITPLVLPEIQVRTPQHISEVFAHHSGIIGALLGFITAYTAHASQSNSKLGEGAAIVIFFSTLFGTLVGETLAHDRPILSTLRLFDSVLADEVVRSTEPELR